MLVGIENISLDSRFRDGFRQLDKSGLSRTRPVLGNVLRANHNFSSATLNIVHPSKISSNVVQWKWGFESLRHRSVWAIPWHSNRLYIAPIDGEKPWRHIVNKTRTLAFILHLCHLHQRNCGACIVMWVEPRIWKEMLFNLVFKRQPTIAPSNAQAILRRKVDNTKMSHQFTAYKKLFLDKPFLVHAICYGLNIGVFVGFCTILNQIVLHYFEVR